MPREVKQEPISIAEAARLIVGSRPSIVDGLRRCVMLGSEVEINTRLLEEVGRVIREKAESDCVLKILEELVSNCNFENIQVRGEFFRAIELLRSCFLK
ncbi:MAG: hypothetical protein KIH09_11430 [Candidatus Freyarchaeota archaeon]|nr:hypothetical protein [Candidatus Jordarchaeia archaeon]